MAMLHRVNSMWRRLTGVQDVRVDEHTNLAAADPDGIKESVASSASIATYTGTALDGAIGTGTISPPRNITITTTSHADIDAVAVVITGLDVNGDAQTDTITLTNGGGTTDVGTKAFKSVSSIVVPAQSGTGGALTFGTGNVIGLERKLRSRAGLAAMKKEIVAGVDISGLVSKTFTNPVVADANAIKTSVASAASIQTYTGAALDGTIGAGAISPPRNITITTTSHADIDAVDVVITGTDSTGATVTDTITLTDAGNTTDSGVKCFATVTSIVVPAQSGTGGALEFGTGLVMGLDAAPKFRNSDVQVLSENEAGTPKAIDALAGTYTAHTTGAPLGGYTPGSAADGAKDYELTYEPLRGTVVSAATSGPNGTYAPPVNPNGSIDYSISYEWDPR
jgi:hypothetical protein